jgi:hypothetical protein
MCFCFATNRSYKLRAQWHQSRLRDADSYELPKSKGTLAAKPDRLDVRCRATRVTLAQTVAQKQQKFLQADVI